MAYVKLPAWEQTCAVDGCGVKFMTNRKRQKYCSKKCSNQQMWKNHSEKYIYKGGRQRIRCLDCNKWFIKVATHAIQAHGYADAREYKEAHGLRLKGAKDTTPVDYREIMHDKVYENGTIENLSSGTVNWFKEGDGRASKIVSESWARRKKNHATKGIPFWSD